MPRSGSHFVETVITTLLLASAMKASAAYDMPHADVSHSHDSPVVSRLAGSIIVGYNETDHDAVALPLSPVHGVGFEKTLSTAGKVTRIAYASPMNKTPTEVFGDFRTWLMGNGFKLLYSCEPDICGGYNFAQNYAQPLLQHDSEHYNDLLWLLASAQNDVRYLLAEAWRGGRKIDIGLLVSQNEAYPVGVLLQVVENGELPQARPPVDAVSMNKALQSEGRVTLYGLQFATDSATLQPESDATLQQMSDLLHQQPQMRVYIIDHTDNSGTAEHNFSLSQRRADSVVEALQTRFGIDANRLRARGLSSWSPLATNRTDEGKAKNRRVEMVEQ